MKKNVAQLTILLFLMFSAASVHASIIQDSSNGWYQIQHFEPIGQSFTAEESHSLLAGMYVGDGNESHAPNDYLITIKLFSGAGIFTSDHELLSQEVDLHSIGARGYANLDISSILFDVGSSYTIALYNDNPRWGLEVGGDLYSGGMFYASGIGHSGTDARFQVVSAPVPEPSTFALVGLGILGVGFARRFRKS